MAQASYITSLFWSFNLLLIVLGGSLQSTETGTWSSPTTLGPCTTYWPQVAMDAQGNTVAVWTNDLTVFASKQVNGKTWEPAQTLYTPTDGIELVTAGIAIDKEGNALAIWEAASKDCSTQYASYLPVNGTEWKSLPNPFPTQPGYSQMQPQLAFDQDGSVLAVRGGYINNSWRIQAARLESASASAWTPIKDLETTYANFNRASVDSQGNAVVVWMDYASNAYVINSAKLLKGDTEWSKIITVKPSSTGGFGPMLAGDPAGNVVVLWKPISKKKTPTINAAYLPSGENQWVELPAPVTLEQYADRYNIILDGKNNAIAIWANHTNDFSLSQVQTATLSLTSTNPQWSAPVDLYSGKSSINQPMLSVDTQGDVLAVWGIEDGSTKGILQGALKTTSQDWTSTFTIATGDNPYGSSTLFPFGTAAVVFFTQPSIQAVTGTDLFKIVDPETH